MAHMDTRDHAACAGRCPPHGWGHWPGQLTFHPDTEVLPDLAPVPALVAWRWALVPVTLGGEAWWYGFGAMHRNGKLEVGWWMVPRDATTDPGPHDLFNPGDLDG